MNKAKLTLRDFTTLIGPAQKIFVIEEDFEIGKDKALYNGAAAKLKNNIELLDREIKFISPTSKDAAGVIWIWIY